MGCLINAHMAISSESKVKAIITLCFQPYKESSRAIGAPAIQRHRRGRDRACPAREGQEGKDDKGLVPALEELAWLPEEAGFAEIRPLEALKLPDRASLRPSRECLQPRRGGVA